ncbi:MAG: type II toxin-antitoxin system PemK/MazF family toxin [Actinomycetota bacterium]|nr:type II toxin-antitoxin system PemK/MazF family toxin [Actinomycetota bacterium]
MRSGELNLSTPLVVPTSRSAQPGILRPGVMVAGEQAQVMTEQRACVARERLGELMGQVSRTELDSLDAALILVFQLD